MNTTPETLVVEQDGPSSIVKLHCAGCKHLRTQYWKEFHDNDGTDSGTSADCMAADRHISTYWYETSATPDWCPRLATLSSKGRGEAEGSCDLCAGKCRGHSFGDASWEPEPGSRAYVDPTPEPCSPVAREDDMPAIRAAVLVAMAEHGVPSDIGEYLVQGNPAARCPPFAIDAVIRAALAQSTPAVGEGWREGVEAAAKVADEFPKFIMSTFNVPQQEDLTSGGTPYMAPAYSFKGERPTTGNDIAAAIRALPLPVVPHGGGL